MIATLFLPSAAPVQAAALPPSLALPLLIGAVAIAAFALIAPWYWIAAAAAVSAYATIMSSRAAAAAQREQARISGLQGEISLMQAEFQAKQAMKAGHEQAMYIRQQSAKQVGSGVELSGSPLAVMTEQIWAGERAAATTMKNAIAQRDQIEAQGNAQWTQGQANSAGLRAQADITEQTGWLRAISGAMSAYAMGSGGGGR